MRSDEVLTCPNRRTAASPTPQKPTKSAPGRLARGVLRSLTVFRGQWMPSGRISQHTFRECFPDLPRLWFRKRVQHGFDEPRFQARRSQPPQVGLERGILIHETSGHDFSKITFKLRSALDEATFPVHCHRASVVHQLEREGGSCCHPSPLRTRDVSLVPGSVSSSLRIRVGERSVQIRLSHSRPMPQGAVLLCACRVSL